jgi:aldehyde dehydrogenase (NAD+)
MKYSSVYIGQEIRSFKVPIAAKVNHLKTIDMSTLSPSIPKEKIASVLQEDIRRIYGKQQAFFASGATRSYAFRKEQLKKIRLAVKKHEDDIIEALRKDFRKSPFETYGTEVGPLYTELRHTIRDLRSWMRPEKVNTPLPFLPSSSWTYSDPLGVTVVIAPWNYPFLLMFRPLISSIAAGNTVILKPSEISANTAEVITTIVREIFDEEFVAVVSGDGEEVGRELLENYHFDHVFFTGSVPVGRKIMEMAAKHLSPVTLELGGKSPCIIDREVDMKFAARKIAWGKFLNAGQTCVAPDYVLVHEDVREQFIETMKKTIRDMYGDDPKQSPDFARIISDKRYATLTRYLDEGRIVLGGQADASERYIAPTLMDNVSLDDKVMQDEIFGPILPMISYKTRAEVMQWIDANPYPLALYIFSSNKKTSEDYITNIRFGGGCVNNTLIHLGNPDLPFGGVGTSGIGQYHGEHGFNTFSKVKSVMKTPTWLDAPLWYAPYKDNIKWVKKIFR